MIAKIVVDVPSRQTNRPYDYRVPEHLAGVAEIGSRVSVPFGPRSVQGFIVELGGDAEVASDKLKEVERVLDLHPPLTADLIELSSWLSRTYLCHHMTALLAMIPGALKVKYERYVEIRDDAAIPLILTEQQQEVVEWVRQRSPILLEALLDRYPERMGLVKSMISEGVLTETQTIRDRHSVKTALTVIPPDHPGQLRQAAESLPSQAHRQKEVLNYLSEHTEPIRLADLLQTLGVTASTVRSVADKGWIRLEAVEVYRDPYAGRVFKTSEPMTLTDEQRQVFDPIVRSLDSRRFEAFLLHGVTGSGKTEVYLQAIQRCLEGGREAIVLVPEISLTSQMVERFKSRFGDLVAVLHSRLSHGERYDEWRKIQRRQVTVAIGARSAIFAPFTRIGLIIIDEEHESSYKQEDSPKYHARDVALERGRQHGAVVILGSATPSLESYYGTKAGSAAEPPTRLLTMASRVEGRPLPAVHTVDMREELKNGNRSMFSRALYRAIEDRLRKNEQTVLLLNRRGYSTFVMCRSCGYVASCPHCDISMTYHRRSEAMRCHYCGYAEREPSVCPDCDSEHIRFFGTGTQRVEEELGRLFPGIRVIRMDVDTTTEKGSHEKWLNQFRNRQADVLLGTQMVAKGLDFPHVTLVGVIAADTVLNIPDFRSAERTFQLLTQVGGRAGRHTLPGEVIVQTYTPEHYSIQFAGQHDYSGFVSREMAIRKARIYPPYCDLILVTLAHERIQLLVRAGEHLVQLLKEKAAKAGFAELSGSGSAPFAEVLGPVASPIPKLKDRYRFQCMVKYRGDDQMLGFVREAVSRLDDIVRQEKLQVSIDVSPQFMM